MKLKSPGLKYIISPTTSKKKKVSASRSQLDESFNEKRIESITDTGIQKILINHLNKFKGLKDENGKNVLPETLAFSSDGIDKLNKNLKELNGGKAHQPIYKVRTSEVLGNKFSVGSDKKAIKYVEAAKGTNLFFAIYADEKGNRTYETIPLNVVIENQKQGALNKEKPEFSSVPQVNINGHKLLFYLNPNDLIYVPLGDEMENIDRINFYNFDTNLRKRIYKIVSFTGNRLYAIPYAVATSIVNKVEYTQLNKLEFTDDGISFKDKCIKLNLDRLGNIKSPGNDFRFKNKTQTLEEPLNNYLPQSSFSDSLKTISPSSWEEQQNLNYEYSASLTPEERLAYLKELNDKAFGVKEAKPITDKKIKFD